MPLLTALMLSFGVSFQASLCPPGVDMGSDMEMVIPARVARPFRFRRLQY